MRFPFYKSVTYFLTFLGHTYFKTIPILEKHFYRCSIFYLENNKLKLKISLTAAEFLEHQTSDGTALQSDLQKEQFFEVFPRLLQCPPFEGILINQVKSC